MPYTCFKQDFDYHAGYIIMHTGMPTVCLIFIFKEVTLHTFLLFNLILKCVILSLFSA